MSSLKVIKPKWRLYIAVTNEQHLVTKVVHKITDQRFFIYLFIYLFITQIVINRDYIPVGLFTPSQVSVTGQFFRALFGQNGLLLGQLERYLVYSLISCVLYFFLLHRSRYIIGIGPLVLDLGVIGPTIILRTP